MSISGPKVLLTGLRLDAATQLLGSRPRALHALRWLYAHPLPKQLPAELPGVRPDAWHRLLAAAELPAWDLLNRAQASDGTTKYVVAFAGATVETVLIPAKGRSTVCVSSQAGCTRSCGFCATATLGFNRNLKAGEIVAQYLIAKADAPSSAPARNVVFMGMGEPMDNLDAVLEAVELLTQSPAPQLAAHQITVSTSGVLPGMRRFLRESRASLALSVNGSSSEQRAAWMPQTRTWSLEDLMAELREDAVRNPKRVHFLEYVLFDGLNDTDQDAERLVAQTRGIRARVNLIPHNAFPGNALRPPPDARMLAFQQRVVAAGVPCFIRWSRGREVAAACGQLALASTPAAREDEVLRMKRRAPSR